MAPTSSKKIDISPSDMKSLLVRLLHNYEQIVWDSFQICRTQNDIQVIKGKMLQYILDISYKRIKEINNET